MKNMTLKNLDKAMQIIMNKGYDKNEAENMAINCFVIAKQFNMSCEEAMCNIENK